MNEGRSPGLWGSTDVSSGRTEARCFWTRSVSWTPDSKPSSCACCREALERVGGTRQITVDVRVIAATNRDLKQQVADGEFREDLFYRLNTFPIELPALRDRPSDIRRLARFFLERSARKIGKAGLSLSPEAETVLLGYAWPGNVRELENTMERLAILCDGVVEADDLPVSAAGPVRPVLFKDIERRSIEDALAQNEGNRTRTARRFRHQPADAAIPAQRVRDHARLRGANGAHRLRGPAASSAFLWTEDYPQVIEFPRTNSLAVAVRTS